MIIGAVNILDNKMNTDQDSISEPENNPNLFSLNILRPENQDKNDEMQ